MSLWLVRGDKAGRFNDTALDEGFAYVSFVEVANLSAATTRKAVQALVATAYEDANKFQIANLTGQLHAFRNRMSEGDLVVLPLRHRSQIAIGRITGPYAYRGDLGGIFHTRSVEWLRTDVPRTDLKQDLLYMLGAFMTVCQVQRNNAAERMKAVVEGKKDPGFKGGDEGGGDDDGNGANPPPDVERIARDQILHYLEENFKGHRLSDLVHAVLRAEGYVGTVSAPGPDGGVDILAGRGALGFENPKLCVQVKSSSSPADVTILRALQGTMATFKADQGLLVSWGGFNSVAEREARLSFFSVRLWNGDDLIDAILKNYDQLDDELQSELPMKRVWALVQEEK